MKTIIINILCFVPFIICLVYILCRYLNLTHAIDPEDEEINYSTDNSEFDAEVNALIQSRKTKN